MTTLTTSTTSLKKSIYAYKTHIEQITNLRNEAAQHFNEIRKVLLLEGMDGLSDLKALQIPKFELGNQLPSVLFIGSQNSGKSSLLNVFLKKSLLPVDEIPCTSRIVRIVYSTENYIKLKDPTTDQERVENFKRKFAKEFIVLKGEDRNDSDKLKVVVEVGLNHPLLGCGIELLDSPGRNENEALDEVVEGFVKKGVVPLIVYVVDGNYHLRENDRNIIRELQNKLPSVTFLFVCNKVDVDLNAEKFDRRDDVEDIEEGSTSPIIDSQEMIERAREKKIAVFKQLKNLNLLPSDDQMDSSENFHGVSSKLVRRSRKNHLQNESTMSFERFEHCLLLKLGSLLRKEIRRKLSTLLSALEKFLTSVVGTQKSLTKHTLTVKREFQSALRVEESTFNLISDLIIGRDSISNTIVHGFREMSAILIKDAQEYEPKGTSIEKPKFYPSHGVFEIASMSLNDEKSYLMALEFYLEMKRSFLDKIFNVLKQSLEKALKNTLDNSVAVAKLTVTATGHPLLTRILRRTLGNAAWQNLTNNHQDAGILGIYYALEDVLESLNHQVFSLLRTKIKQWLNKYDLHECKLKPVRPRDPFWRGEVAQYLLLKFDCEELAVCIRDTCTKVLIEKRREFKEEIESFRVLAERFVDNPGLASKIADYIPLITHLTVMAHSLRFGIERDPPELGPKIMSTAAGDIYCCTSPFWFTTDECSVVKVVAKEAVRKKVWDQTMSECLHLKDINDKLGTQHPNLLTLTGWVFPEPDELHIVMEKTEWDLLTELKRRLSWKRRKEMAIHVAKGVQAIHNMDYVYQDLKPQNIMVTANGTAKIDFWKTEKPFEVTQLGLPFHISPEMFENCGKTTDPSTSFDIYAFGSLLWVLCEGSGDAGPKAFSHCQDIDSIKFAVCDREITPERPPETPDSWWRLMKTCWKERNSVTIETVLTTLQDIQDDTN